MQPAMYWRHVTILLLSLSIGVHSTTAHSSLSEKTTDPELSSAAGNGTDTETGQDIIDKQAISNASEDTNAIEERPGFTQSEVSSSRSMAAGGKNLEESGSTEAENGTLEENANSTSSFERDVTATASDGATTTEEYEEMAEEEELPECFNTTEAWQTDLLRRVVVVEDNIRYQIAALLGPATANRRALLRRAQYHLMLLEKIVSQISTAPEDESGASDTLYRSERNLNRIGWVVYRGRNGWHFYDCCYQSPEAQDAIETLCGQRGDPDTLSRMQA